MTHDLAAQVGERIDAVLLRRELEQASGKLVEQADTITRLTARVKELEEAEEDACAKLYAAAAAIPLNEAGYKTDAALWIDRAIASLDAAITKGENRG